MTFTKKRDLINTLKQNLNLNQYVTFFFFNTEVIYVNIETCLLPNDHK